MEKLESIELFAVRNHASTEAFKCQPWDLQGVSLPKNITTKKKFEKWAAKPDTKHVFYSGYEGYSNLTRISKGNKPHLLHAIVVDYDIEITRSDIESALEKFEKRGYTLPNIIHQTKSQGARAIWLLEQPVQLFSPSFIEQFLKLIKKKLRLTAFLPGMDENAFKLPTLYYELGHNWLVDHDSGPRLTKNFIGRCVFDAVKKTTLKDAGSGFVSIPLDIVEAELKERFPGRWKGEFTENSRGPRFWEDEADAHSAIVKSGGMVCYTGEYKFVSWANIFGQNFVQEFEENRIGGAINDVYFDGKHYWNKNPLTGLYESFNKDDMTLRLEVCNRLSNSSQNGTPSEVKQAMVMIQDSKRIQGALPFIYVPKTIIYRDGKRFLNTSDVQIMLHEEGGPYYEDDFPWLANFINLLFKDKIQRDHLIAWIQHFWKNGVLGTPAKGHALFLAGDTNQGKTLFSQVIASMFAGGHADASSYLKGETNFNKQLFMSALWTVDDTTPASDFRQQAKYSAMVKKITADQTFEYMAKFYDAVMVDWVGRLIVTCNTDPESIRVIPNLDISNLDKILALMVDTVEPGLKDFKPRLELRAILERELPFFLNYIYNWERPDYIKADQRYGFQAYIHKDIKEASHDSSELTYFEELLAEFLKEYFFDDPKAKEWKGNTTRLHMEMSECEGIKNIVSKMTVNHVGRQLNKLVTAGTQAQKRRDGKSRYWIFNRKNFI